MYSRYLNLEYDIQCLVETLLSISLRIVVLLVTVLQLLTTEMEDKLLLRHYRFLTKTLPTITAFVEKTHVSMLQPSEFRLTTLDNQDLEARTSTSTHMLET